MSIELSNYKSINLGHGSGGLMTRELLDEIIFKVFNNPYLNQKHDGSIVKIEGEIAISTDSFVVSPVFFKGGNIGELAVHGTVNDIAMCGGIPEYLSLAFIVEEGMDMNDFIKIVESIKQTADECGVQVITGDTKVVERGKGDKIFVNTTGFGKVHPGANISTDRIKVGDKIIVSGYIAQHGMAIMSERKGLQFESDIISDTTNLNYLVKDLLDGFGEKIHLLRDPTRGGLSGVLSEIANDTAKGVSIYEKDIPLEKQVAAACEILGLDPLYVANEGVFVVIVDNEIADEVIDAMRNDEKGRNAVCIGEISNENPSKVVMHSIIGGKRIVSPLIGEQLPRIC
ncbi:MAG: hydrogenase expression/formation protein HypE [Bacteroidia bacterium]|nr:hydrogenase expression/formation protein HypE [Bacteroidia bacterium]NNF30094.1 hydrogenase expression/formation protein HypE [Flavobacteriaceae bacterium]MBT8274972.1 hydrogenase expression/formation protein HypE [Bacteroidia bacterium]NNJ81979.1 hydrogenase expression/formation protein HypE [Flavobacteriaceae bacterium]NNK55543.1 hydrogenase expression/formation protein HypE [Flavobacteriaceae bacterium]